MYSELVVLADYKMVVLEEQMEEVAAYTSYGKFSLIYFTLGAYFDKKWPAKWGIVWKPLKVLICDNKFALFSWDIKLISFLEITTTFF